ncbi:polyamine ABC transporter substrate-binding protein [Acuticoccus sediminis]|nr:ABC transporter substrate-binding protein [Acuticoccus sediminis]
MTVSLNRRKFLTLTAAGVAVGPFVHTSRARAARELVVVSWGGSYQDAQRAAHFAPFTAETGINIVEISEGPRVAKLKTQIDSGSLEWDVMDFETSDMLSAGSMDLLEPIDTSVVDTSTILPDAVDEFGIANVSWSKLLGFNTAKYPNGEGAPTGWADFWNVEAFPGRRALQDLVKPNLEFALIADGVSLNELYPLDVERAFAALDRIRPHVDVWWGKTAQGIQILANGEVDMGTAPNGRLEAAKRDGQNVGYTWNDGAVDFDWWCVAKGAPNRDLAMEFINFAIAAEGQAKLASIIDYGPSNTEAWLLIDPERAATLPTAPDNLKAQFVLGNSWWQDNEADMLRRWQMWKLG